MLANDASKTFTAIAESVRPSVVKVTFREQGVGSGVVWDSDGSVITNAHVVHTRQLAVETHEGAMQGAEVAAHDPRRDLALLRCDGGGWQPASQGYSERLRVGEPVFAFGNAFGVNGALAAGIVHALGPVTGLEHQNWIQADVRLAPGNSGGPLLDTRGRVVGINSMMAGGLGLAIPASDVTRFVRGERETRIGVSVQPVPIGVGNTSILGLYVHEVAPESPAAVAGIRPGDLLTGAGGHAFSSPYDLLTAIRRSTGVLPLALARAGRQIAVDVSLRS